jgi:DNA-directed RNA polymerase subunit beta'
MAHLDHNEAFEEFKNRTLEGIKANFPIEGRDRSLVLKGLEVADAANASDDLDEQHKAKVEGRTFSRPIYATVSVVDKQTGKEQTERMKIGELPVLTRRYSYIVGGQEYQVDNQWQLKPGIYTQRKADGSLKSEFNIQGKKSFNLKFEPETKQFLMERGSSKTIPAYPILKTMGIDDETLERQWGKDILQANRDSRNSATALSRFYKADKKRMPADTTTASTYVRQTLLGSQVRADAVEKTLGRNTSTVDGDILLRATKRMLDIQGGAPEDDRDSLVFKDLRSVGDYAYDKLTDWRTQSMIRTKIQRQLNSAKATSPRDILRTASFGQPIMATFKKNSAARTADQINPVEMLASSMQTTVMGPGGIQSEHGITPEVKYINPSHFGFLDPLHTPEGGKTGVTLHLPMGVKKVGKEPRIPVYNLKTGKKELIGPAAFMSSSVALPDQMKWDDKGRPVPVAAKIKVSSKDNEIEEVSSKDVQYAMYHPSQAFSLTSNLIPFMGNTSGNRASYATHHIEQAISLADRDVPLIQAGTGVGRGGIKSFEEFVGRNSAHTTPVAGVVVKADKQHGIVVKDDKGQTHKVPLYNNFPLNDAKAVLDSTPIVKPGDHVRAGQVVGDTNFTKGGSLALGKNLRVGYIPYKGYNFEDGVVISESAADALKSVHMHKPSMKLQPTDTTDVKKFTAQHPEAFRKEQLQKVGADGIVQVGQRINPGDPLVLAMRPLNINDQSGIARVRKSLSGQQTDASLRWDKDYAGEVVGVHQNKKGEVTVHVKTIEPMTVGDKITGRYGNKGIVTKVIPDAEMPRTKDGQPIQVALNPAGIPGRMNVGQVLETALSKVARKTGQPIIVNNFEYGVDQLEKAKEELKKHGLEDKEELIDPKTGLSLGKVLVGEQHMLKLQHQVDKKVSVRSGMALRGEEAEGYDNNLIPKGGGKAGAQSMGNLGMNVLLAHGATANIREMQTWKSQGEDPAPEHKRWRSQHNDVWNAIQTGAPLPAPKPTFAFQKFTDMLKASGINVEKKGNKIQLTPLTDKEIEAMSSGELSNPSRLTYAKTDKDGQLKPIKGGLFDEAKTGGVHGKKWAHFSLAEPMPNPIFEEPIKKVLGMNKNQFADVVNGDKAIDPKTGQVVALGKGLSGGAGIAAALKNVDVAKELELAKKELEAVKISPDFAHGANTQKLDTALKRVKYLSVLQDKGIRADEAYVLTKLPVIPPAMRQPSIMNDGNVRWEDINGLYKSFAEVNDKLKELKGYESIGIGDADMKVPRQGMYDGLRALVGVGQSAAERDEDKPKGILRMIHGSIPKEGYFQKTLMSRKQDMTMRSTIVPEPAMNLDDVGVPAAKALTLFRPFVIKKMTDMGVAQTPLQAQEMLRDKNAIKNQGIFKALEAVTAERPLLMKRDPALHMHSIQAFNARPVKGNAIKIHPLVVGGYNADFDGDTMSMYVPISNEAVEEARGMMPSRNLFNAASGHVAHAPSLESSLGLYKMTQVQGSGSKSFKSAGDAMKAVQAGKLSIDELANISGYGKTTAGRVLLADALPKSMQDKMLHDHSFVMNKKGVNQLYGDLAKNHPDSFADAANRLKDYGFDASYGQVRLKHPTIHVGQGAIDAAEQGKFAVLPIGSHSLGLDDLAPDKAVRDKIVNATQRRVDMVNRSNLTKSQKEARAVEEWTKATAEMQKAHVESAKKKPDNLFKMYDAGIKPGMSQYQQLKLAPMLLEDASGRTIPMPVTKSYSEGLDMAGYWIQSSGARKGSIQKVQEVQDPGYFSKQLINTAMNLQIRDEDCGTQRGVGLSVSDKDVYDRELASDLKVKGRTFAKGTVLSPDVVGQIRKLDKGAQVVVRSSLKCEHGKGLCQHCAGISPTGKYYDVGTNLGILSAQSLGERSVQLALKAFHSGGVKSTGGAGVLGAFDRTKQLTALPKKIPDAASLAMTSGKIEKVQEDRTGTNIWIAGQKHFVPKDRAGRTLTTTLPGVAPPGWAPPKVGAFVEAGQSLSDPTRSFVNPHDLYKATRNIEKVQNFLTNELHGIYKDEGVRRQHIETVVKALSNTSRVRSPGDAQNILRGEYQPTSQMRALNAELTKAGKRPVSYSPILKGVDVAPLTVHDDWMAKLNYAQLTKTLTEAAAEGSISDLHGMHPVPGAAYGAEFGIAKKHKDPFAPPHIKNLPTWSY